MKQYFFVLGRYPDLSLAELKSVFARLSLPFKLLQHSEGIALVESSIDLPIQEMNSILGGIVKIGSVIESLPLSSLSDLPDLFSYEVLFNEFFSNELRKVEFGVSIYSCGGKQADVAVAHKTHQQITLSIKKELEENRIKAHFPQLKETVLSSASVEKNKLLKKGAEIVVIITQDSVLVGKTDAVQEFELFSRRDYGRPVRDMKSGVMPPKLARMMINIAQISPKHTLLDPFCGSGTVLQEALQLGYKKIIGTDKSAKAIKDSRENIEWYIRVFNTSMENADVTIKHAEVTKLTLEIEPDSIGGIVTEPYLGPTLRKRLNPKEIDRSTAELSDLYIKSFKEFYKVLHVNGSVVMILPAFQTNKPHFMPILQDIEKIGFTQLALSGSDRKSVIVGNKRDFVQREIVKFEKK